jgi:hypothetical protein
MATFTGFPWFAVLAYTVAVLAVVAVGVLIGSLWLRYKDRR